MAAWKNVFSQDSGHALVELAVSLPLLLVLVLGVIDFGRAIYDVQVITNLTAEGSSMASRGISPLEAAQAVVTDAGTNLNMSTLGCVIVTQVYNPANAAHTLQVTAQSTGQGACGGITSKVGCVISSTCKNDQATIPAEAASALLDSSVPFQTLYVTEIYYTYKPITPIGHFLNNILPAQLYNAAYY